MIIIFSVYKKNHNLDIQNLNLTEQKKSNNDSVNNPMIELKYVKLFCG